MTICRTITIVMVMCLVLDKMDINLGGDCSPPQTNKAMKKIIITIVITITTINAIIMLAMASIIRGQRNDLNTCHAYIERLHDDYPDYIDTTSGTDEYSDYMSIVNH